MQSPSQPRTTSEVEPVYAELLTRQPWLVHAFSTRSGGTSTVYGRSNDLNLGFTAQDSRAMVLSNRRRFLDSVGGGTLVLVKQIHSARFIRVHAAEPGPLIEVDGLLTNDPGVLLGIQTADCVPVLIADPVTRSVAAFHAGWRGTVQRIVERGITGMVAEYGSNPRDLLAVIGPSIGACCYAVGEEVTSAFGAEFGYAETLFTGPRNLDLKEANRRQLLDAGLKPQNVAVILDCTSCRQEQYFSHRAQHGVTGRMLSVIGISQKS